MLIDMDSQVYSPFSVVSNTDTLETITIDSFLDVLSNSIVLHEGDYGQVLYVYLGSDISSATNHVLNVTKPDGTEVVWVCNLYTFGMVFNYLSYKILPGDLLQTGLYTLQSSITIGSLVELGETFTLQVSSTLDITRVTASYTENANLKSVLVKGLQTQSKISGV